MVCLDQSIRLLLDIEAPQQEIEQQSLNCNSLFDSSMTGSMSISNLMGLMKNDLGYLINGIQKQQQNDI